ncbi:MAG: glycosyltransferase family 4 protein [Flavobacteriales bacterium]|nr:glycosyltransferase family 4 protein [Flavobacteriales bacterium]MCB9198659.1 glycosyltransferase family 4 protein [Flavobacteriales bacterium]
MKQQLHLISFDVPYPPNYGGVVDVYYKIKALHEKGIGVHLHCFEYGRGQQSHLNEICETVNYYRRDENKLNFLKKQPYVVASRANDQLLSRLREDNLPIIIEGLHNCWLIEALKPSDRKIFVRTHNIEHDYYNGLAKVEKSLAKRQYYKWEASKLEKYEEILSKADGLLAISPSDAAYFQKKYGNATLLPAFHSGTQLSAKTGAGDYSLYHANMAVGENIEAATFLIEEVFSRHPEYYLIIAGSNPPPELMQLASQYKNIEIRANISVEHLDQLISEAHVNVLPTFQPTGIKLKLLSALYKGRFVIANDEMIDNTGLESVCYRANRPEDWLNMLELVFSKEFAAEDLDQRQTILFNHFDNRVNAEIILEKLGILKSVET